MKSSSLGFKTRKRIITTHTPITLHLGQLYNYTSGVMGSIWFESEGYVFLEKSWNDFAEVITAWWTQHLIEAFRSNNKWYEKSLLFMDGPCEAVLRNGTPVTIHFKHDDVVDKSFAVTLTDFAHTVLAARRQLLQQAIDAGWKKSVHADFELCDWLEMLIEQEQAKTKRPVN